MLHAYDDEDNVPMSEELLPADKNCHERCPYSEICFKMFHCKGSHNPNYPYECPNYDKINDLAHDIVPFSDAAEIDTGGDGDDS